ncbi:MAG TPA: FUSC family protein, partial [Symbiobacteriaceae bacterium]|nr:FUSC family protein [Symbiobacteriaceae bacterium]
GLALAFSLGSIGAALTIWGAALTLGLVGAGAFVLTELFGMPVPGAFFFVFACAVATGMPGAPAVILTRAGLLLLGGIPAWLLAMAGWLWDPHGPEQAVVAGAFRALAALLAAVGTDPFHSAQHQATLALRAAERALPPDAVRWRRPSDYARLRHLTVQAEALFLAIVERGATRRDPTDPALPALLRALADAVADPDRAACLVIPPSAEPESLLTERLRLAVAIAAALAEPAAAVAPVPQRESLGSRLAGVLDKRSAVVPRALRVGLMLVLSHLIAYGVGAHTPYWVSVSCMAVMMGITAVTTLRRSLQRVVGTIGGALLGLLLLHLQPSGLALVLLLMGLQFLTEWVILLNYAFAITFATPLAFMMAEVGHPGLSAQYLVSTRLFDICLGSALGLAGTLLLRRRPSNRRLLVVLGDALHLAAAVTRAPGSQHRLPLRRALITLRIVYDDLLREGVAVEDLWPAVVAVQRVGYLLLALSDQGRLSAESQVQVAALLADYADGITAPEQLHPMQAPQVPEYPALGEAVRALGEGLAWQERGSKLEPQR